MIINSVTNDQNGQSVTVTIGAPASGAPVFHASGKPGVLGSVVAATLLTSTTYRVTLADGSYGGQEIGWWVTGSDNAGVSAQVPVWVINGTDNTLPCQIREKLRDILVANTPLINLWISQKVPAQAKGSSVVKTVMAGMGQGVRETPAIVIISESLPEDFGLDTPYGATVTPTLSITCVHFHNEAVSYRELIEAFAWGVRTVLNQAQYIEIELPSAMVLTRCLTSVGPIEEYLNGTRYETVATLSFNCEMRIPHV